MTEREKWQFYSNCTGKRYETVTSSDDRSLLDNTTASEPMREIHSNEKL